MDILRVLIEYKIISDIHNVTFIQIININF